MPEEHFRRYLRSGGCPTNPNTIADTLIVALVFATLAQAWSWLGSYAGILSFGHAVFFGIGAYAVAASNFRGGSPWYGALGGALFAVLVAAVFGGLFLRGRVYVFSAITLAAGAAVEPFVAAQRWLGAHDSFVFPLHTGFLNLQFGAKWPYLLLALMVFGVTQALTLGLRATRLGCYLRAVRTNALAARSVGIAGRPLQLLALIASAFVTSVAGSFSAQYALGVSPQATLALALSLDIALIGSVAGSASVWAAPAVALVYVLLAKYVPLHPAGTLGDVVLVAQGLLIVLIARVCPRGVFGGGLVRPARSVPVRRVA